MFEITDRTALRNLNVPCEKNIFQRICTTGKETKYILTRHKPDINQTNLSKDIIKAVGITDNKKYLLNRHSCQTCAKRW